jgi:excisionase family DNA binding protein
MQTVVLTQLTTTELGQLVYEQVERFFSQQQPIHSKTGRIGGIELAEEITRLKRPTIYNLVSTRQIPFSKQGKKLYFYESDLLRWLEDGKRKTQAELALDAEKLSPENSRQSKSTVAAR